MQFRAYIPPEFFVWLVCLVYATGYAIKQALKVPSEPVIRCPRHTHDWMPCCREIHHTGDCIP